MITIASEMISHPTLDWQINAVEIAVALASQLSQAFQTLSEGSANFALKGAGKIVLDRQCPRYERSPTNLKSAIAILLAMSCNPGLSQAFVNEKKSYQLL